FVVPRDSPAAPLDLHSFPTRRSSDLVLVYGVVATIIIVRQARAIGYAERSDDLLIRGIMFHRATVVPYGRLQFVDVDAGPIDRIDRKSTRLNSSHVSISYAVFCLKKK